MSCEDKTNLRYVKATDFMKALHEAGLLPQYPWCTRVVIDAKVGYMVQMYVDQIPSGALLKIPPLMEEDHETQ